MEPDASSIVVERHLGAHAYFAKIGDVVVGKASAWTDSAGSFTIQEVVVHAAFRRRGVARALYSRIEAEAGKLLVPAVSLSDDAFEFWKRFRPEAVALDLRHRRTEFMDQKVEKSGRLATIIRVSARVVTARYDDAVERANSETCIHRRELDQALAAGRARVMSTRIAQIHEAPAAAESAASTASAEASEPARRARSPAPV
ncbi:GNAT family N-acetyltransferase [Paucibacter soli]|uniref:GNAT family N-acetyltransferase n=1 Tax=Paucibacter soli TaxID=3133433 RepID=UPI00309EE17B